MKASRMFPILSLLAFSQLLWGQLPQTISYQGVLRDAAGDLVADGNYSLTFTLYDASIDPSINLWSETQTVAVTEGLFKVSLGSGAATFAATGLAFDQQYWLGIKVGADIEMTPRTPLESAPYSFVAESVVGSGNVFPSTGNVGIGTVNPAAVLDVNGEIRVSVGLYSSGALTLTSDTATDLKLNDGTPGNVLIANGGGNVGIGTTTPGYKLDINAGTGTGARITSQADLPNAEVLQIFNDPGYTNVANEDVVSIRFLQRTTDAAGTATTRIGQVLEDANHATRKAGLVFYTDLTATQVERMRITAAGNVGIGTTTPATKLHVAGSIRIDNAYSYALSNSIGQGGNALKAGPDDYTWLVPARLGFGTKFMNWDENSALMTILDGGNVGIGTTTPGAGLVVAGSGLWDASIGIENIPNNMEWRMAVETTNFSLTKVSGVTFTPLRIYSNSFDNALVIDSTGVDIGADLNVAGDVTANSVVLPATTRYFSIPASGFTPDDNSMPYAVQPYYVYGTTLSDSLSTRFNRFHAPVHLPQGATITQFQVGMTDDSTPEDITVNLYWVSGNASSVTLIASVTSTGESATFTVTSTANHVVNNQNNTYMVLAYWTMPTAGAATDLQLRNARIDYTVTSPLP